MPTEYIHILFFLLLQILFVLADKQEIQKQINTNQKSIENVQKNNYISTIQSLVYDSKNIAQDNQRHKNRAFPDNDFCSQCLAYRNGPTNGKTN